jgi:hypothetical protein
MPRKSIGDPGDVKVDLHFPYGGLNTSCPYERQPNVPTMDRYARTAPTALNVRGFEPLNLRMRGGSRFGLVKYIPQAVIADWIIQDLNCLVTVSDTPVQPSNSGRVVNVVAVSQGSIYIAHPGDTVWTATTNNTGESPPLNFSGEVFSAPNAQKLWYCDGINYVVCDPQALTVDLWTASQPNGPLPVDSENNTARLIETWRGRTCLSGVIGLPQDIYCSAVDDPTNYDYGPLSFSPTQAVPLTLGSEGLIGDAVMTMIPYTDDVLIVGGANSIYMYQGDPLAGGQRDLVTSSIGMCWGRPWCMTPDGTIFFVSAKGAVFSFVPGQQPQRMSQAIEKLLLNIDTGLNSIRAVYEDRMQAIRIFITPLAAPGIATHFTYELRTNAWWTDQFASTNFDPIACTIFEGNTPGDRVPLIGSWDGYVRSLSPTEQDDDGLAIASNVVIGPLNTKDFDTLLAKDMQGVLGETSGQVSYQVFTGTTAEKALSSNPVASGTFGPGRNLTNFVRRSGHAIYVKLLSSNPWAMEAIRIRIQSQGKVQQRGR